MARNAATAIENSFIKGLITEATGLNFPENACTETFDCVFDERGRVTRRLGITNEDSYFLNALSASITDKVLSYFVWENVAGQGDLTFVVIQFGDTLYFFQTSETQSLSANLLFSISLNTFLVSGASGPGTSECGFAAGNGALFVTHQNLTPFYVTYDPDMLTHTETEINVQIRDFEGEDDGLEPDARPTTLTTNHKYNLYNQGWYATAKGSPHAEDDRDDVDVQVLSYWTNQRGTGDYPSNADIWWTFKNAFDLYVPAHWVDRTYRGNTKAPSGHYLLDAFRQDRSTASGISSIDVVSSGVNRPTVCAFHANRLFLGGTQADEFSNKVYFSQIIDDEKKYSKCYQSNDPTSETLNDLLPTDGGVLAILGAGHVVYVTSVLNFLVIFATNGIWTVQGSQGQAFAANDYSISKISDLPTQSKTSFLFVNGFPVWWTNDGIFTLLFDSVSSTLQVKSLTDQTIKSFFNEIPVSSKNHAKGAYNSKTKVIEWTYRSSEASSTEEQYQHDRALNFNTLTQAFYPWRITQVDDTLGPFVSGVFSTKGLGIIRGSENVTDNAGAIVVDSIGDPVTVSSITTEYLSATFRYLTVVKNGATYYLTFAQERDPLYLDWTLSDYESYALSGFKVHGQGIVRFQANYLTVYMDSEDNSSCFFQGWWNYANTPNSGKVTTPQQVYKDDPAFSVSKYRIKVRGSGEALQFKFYSESGKPFNVIGWAGFETGNTVP